MRDWIPAAKEMRADLVVLSDDLFTIAPEEIAGVRVEMTIFDGRVIDEKGQAGLPVLHR